jgi:Putative auto-transporter adhesin, head GIN domain
MKNITLIFLISINISSIFSQNGPLIGKGKILHKEFNNKNFDKISFEDFDGKIEVEIGKAFEITVDIDENLAPMLSVKQNIDENLLRICLEYNKNGRLYLEDTHIKIKISLPEASLIMHRGNTYLHISGIKSRYFRLENTGNGDVNMVGSVDELELKKTGNGNIKASNLVTKIAKVRSFGNGNVLVNSQISLYATGAGNGSVMQFGPGKIEPLSGIAGNGDVRKM